MKLLLVIIIGIVWFGLTTCCWASGEVVQVGLDRVARGEIELLAGRRVGLIVHAASLTQEGNHAIDVLLDGGVEVIRLFSPEHGLRGRAAAGERVESAKDPVSNLPVASLYGNERKPRSEDLSDLDTLVFDLQGAGIRFYTYVSTLILALEAAVESDIEFVVLDRPNPLGGDRIEGPLSAPREIVPKSFVNMAPGPLIHGLTLGEMARFVNSNLERPARLSVIAMQGWDRSMVWEDTGRSWTAPSPNLRTAEAALAYPGTAMFEATNVSEGRGTPAPFLMIGAPWLDVARVLVDVPGFAFQAIKFRTAASAAAPSPKYLGEECSGLRVGVTDGVLASPYRLGLELVSRMSQQEGFEWKNSGANLTRLLGTPRVFEMLTNENSVQQILDADRGDHAAWLQSRRAFLLYE